MAHHAFYDIMQNNSYHANYRPGLANSREVGYYARYLLQKAMSVFEWTIPDNWDLNYLLYCLYVVGFCAVTDIPGYGVVPQWATISGFNIYYNPAKAIISNPIFNKTYEIDLGVNGDLIHLTPDYAGIMDCVFEHAEMLANATAAINMNLYNSRLSYIFYAKNKAQAQSYKKMYDEVGTGTPAVFVDKNLIETDAAGKPIQPYLPFNADLNGNYITDKILEDIRRIEHLFAQKVGLPNANSEKKERLSVDEVNKTDTESVSNVALWEESLDESIKRVKALYPDLNLSFKRRFESMEEVFTDEYDERGNNNDKNDV